MGINYMIDIILYLIGYNLIALKYNYILEYSSNCGKDVNPVS